MARETWLRRNKLMVGIVTVLVALSLLALLWHFWLGPTVFEANRQAGQDIAKNSMNSDKAIQNYRWFRQQWYDIQSQREQLDNYKQELEQFYEVYGKDPSEWSRTAETRHGRIQERITGARNQVSSLVAEYNARQSDATRAIFQCGLPYNVDEKLFIADATGVEYTSQEAKKQTPPSDPADCQFAQDASDSGASDT